MIAELLLSTAVLMSGVGEDIDSISDYAMPIPVDRNREVIADYQDLVLSQTQTVITDKAGNTYPVTLYVVKKFNPINPRHYLIMLRVAVQERDWDVRAGRLSYEKNVGFTTAGGNRIRLHHFDECTRFGVGTRVGDNIYFHFNRVHTMITDPVSGNVRIRLRFWDVSTMMISTDSPVQYNLWLSQEFMRTYWRAYAQKQGVVLQ